MGLELQRNVPVEIGFNGRTKPHKFDLGNEKVIVECKSHSWTENDNVPSAKLAAWNEAMHIFCATPSSYRKIFCVMHNYSAKHGKTLAEYYLHTYAHLIPEGVEICVTGHPKTSHPRAVKTSHLRAPQNQPLGLVHR